MGQSVFANSLSSHSILFCSSGMLTLIAAWHAMLAAMLVRILSRFSDLFLTLELIQDFVQQVLDVTGRDPGGRGLNRNRARAEWFHLKAVPVQFVGDLGEDRHLARSQLDDQRHQQLLLLRRFRQAQLADFLKQNAFVGDVLVDDPQALRIDRQDEGVANLANGAKRA